MYSQGLPPNSGKVYNNLISIFGQARDEGWGRAISLSTYVTVPFNSLEAIFKCLKQLLNSNSISELLSLETLGDIEES